MMRLQMTACQDRLAGLLNDYLPAQNNETPLYEAMRYACLNGGKRLRPLLVFYTGQMLGAKEETLNPIAVAVELIHCYSLVHDDLPAMDNDDLRRGKPTCHKVFTEATAILAGDALLTLAFEILSHPEHLPGINQSTILKIIRVLSQASGATGMVKGQSIDLNAQGKTLNLDNLMQMHRAKTGALIAASVQCGAIASGASKSDLEALHNFGLSIGLAFQIKDDLLDVLGKSETMGKKPGQDVKNQKCTFVSLLGLNTASDYLTNCYNQSLIHLARFGAKAEPLRHLAAYIVGRET